MSLQAETARYIPQETMRIARAIYPKGNRTMALRDKLGEIYQDSLFSDGAVAKNTEFAE